ncbi:LysR family transcriptional regulator [Evansella halocellulosilytica]|uniref:LysR family transcriptional regulator n=1 Tax=Evansella halocellulosilytica TaxID=2011013 RepID=UPI000BB9572B|nr:LysR family transcriptional regulator [Evansella halocellulosilytica]
MDQKDWLILKTLNEEKNITRASEKLFISQPALTYRIKQLEKDMGITILWRNKRGVKFSAEGDYLVNYSLRMLKELQKMKDRVVNMNNSTEGTIRLGVSSNFARFALPDILRDFTSKYKNIQFVLYTGLSPEIVKMLDDEDVYVGIIRGDNKWNEQQIKLNKETICIISKVPIKMEELPSLPRISYRTDSELHGIIERWWQKNYTVPPNITMHLDNIETSRKLVLNGLGYAIIPSIGLNEVEEDLYIYPIKDQEGKTILRNTSLIYKDNSLNFPVVNTFIDFLKEYYKA